MSDFAQFQYSPLDLKERCIRLVEIVAITHEDGEDVIECKTHKYKVPMFIDRPRSLDFDALSYQWGDEKAVKQILLDGDWFTVRENLWHALKALKEVQTSGTQEACTVAVRLPTSVPSRLYTNIISLQWKQVRDDRSKFKRLIWIDAICIDQENVAERNHQVGLMNEIFSRCSTVIVWLGPSTSNSIVAVNHIWGLGAGGFEHQNDHDALLDLLNRPYWKRMWIIQEIFLAPDIIVLSGQDIFLWEELRETLRRHRLAKTSQDHCGCLERQWHEHLRQSPGCRIVDAREHYTENMRVRSRTPLFAGDQLVSLLMDWADQECSDKLDKVYALLGLIPQLSSSPRPCLRADYKKKKEDLFRELMVLLLDFGATPNERRAFCARLLKSLEICPFHPTVREALAWLAPLFAGAAPFPSRDDVAVEHARKCFECRDQMRLMERNGQQHRAAITARPARRPVMMYRLTAGGAG